MSAKRKGDRTALLSCAAYAAEICTKSASTTGGVQLAVFSYGFNMVECTARLFSSLPSEGKITVVCIPHGGNVNDISRFTEDLKLEMGLLEVPLLVHSIEDGTGTKERCREYQSGGVVICSSRNFCMDLLHRRVSVDLVELCVFIFPRYMNTNFLTGSVSSAAFSIEILLRGAGHSTKSKAKIFSDDARWAASMVQRHHMGLENFIRELHISDVQLFPRFRLEFVKHFESISQQHSLNVTCVDLPVEESTALLDSCLRKILVEVLSELVKLEKTVLKNSHHSDATEKGESPAVRVKQDDGSSTGRVEGHVQGRPWRDKSSKKSAHFSRISDSSIMDLDTRLDADMVLFTTANGPLWPFKGLVESMLHVRKLRRCLRRSTKYDFFLMLEDLLSKRTKLSAVAGGNSVPDALWTLSSHFSDAITIATHRVGSYEKGTPQTNHPKVIEVLSSDEDDEVVYESHAPPSQDFFSPNEEAGDATLDYVYNLSLSWCRHVLKCETTPQRSLLLITPSRSAMHQTAQRMLYSKKEFEQILFADFLRKYRARYGVATFAEPEGLVHSISDEEGEEELLADANFPNEERIADGKEKALPASGGAYTERALPNETQAVHEVLMSQACWQRKEAEVKKAAHVAFEMKATSDYHVTLCAVAPSGSTSRESVAVHILDGRKLSPSYFLSVLLRSESGAACREQAVGQIIFTERNLDLLRVLETAQERLSRSVLSSLKIVVISCKFADDDFSNALSRETESFQTLAQTKANLVETLLADRSLMRETENMLDKAVLASRSSRSLMSANGGGGDGGKSAVAPLVIVDEREFRSTLPYQLYRRGLDIVPLTLTTADYVLSPSFGVERKSVQDFCMSIQSGRISHQLALLSSRFEFPICLIEFESNHPFRLSFKSAWGSSLKASHMSHMYSQIGSIVTAFPKKSVAVENEDPCNSILTSRGMDTNSEVQTAESERSHYAKEILMRFPGVKDSNVESVMAASGSLAGLAQLTKEALVAAMGEHDGQLLHSFLSASLKES